MDVAMLCAHGQSSPVETLDATLSKNKSHSQTWFWLSCVQHLTRHNRRGSESLQLLKIGLAIKEALWVDQIAGSNLWSGALGQTSSLQSVVAEPHLIWYLPNVRLDMEHLWGSSSNSNFITYRIQNCSNFKAISNTIHLLIYPTSSFPFSKGSHHYFRRSLSKAQTTQASANTLQFTIWSICKWIMLNQLVSLRWQHLDVKWMDGVVKRRHRKYASLYSLFNFTACSMTSSVTGHLNKFIRTLSLAFCQTRFRREQTKYIIIHST